MTNETLSGAGAPAPGSSVILLDGGMGQELTRRSAKPAMPLWSAQVLLDEPELVEDVHHDFIMAGARVITLSAYSATPVRLEKAGRGASFERLQRDAVTVAKRARWRAGRPVSIAGCLPPLVASYRPDLSPDFTEALEQYRAIVSLQAPDVDLFLAETLPTAAEAEAASLAAWESGHVVWTGLTVDDADGTRLRSGELLADGIAAARRGGASAVLVNCSTPEAVDGALPVLAADGMPFGAYANGFTTVAPLAEAETVDVLEARHDVTPARYAATATAWAEAGAAIVGGCCEIGPDHIRALAERLEADGFTLAAGPRAEPATPAATA